MKNTPERTARLLPNGVPKYVRCYDQPESGDRYTVCFVGRVRHKCGAFPYLGMSANPFHPQGIGQHGESDKLIDVNAHGFAPAIGRKNHLGRRIRFDELPEDCRRLVLSDYKEIWGLNAPQEKGQTL
jgi:hypothetical protein